jgi:hypothetical protein
MFQGRQRVTDSPYLRIQKVVHEVSTSGIVAPGSRGALFAAIDALRLRSAPTEHVTAAERIAVALHQFDGARHDRDLTREQAVRQTLNVLSEDWTTARMPLARH